MLVVKVWGLPKFSEAEIVFFHGRIVEAAVSVDASWIKTEKDMLVWFPSDLMIHGLGEDILVEISSNFPVNSMIIYSLAQRIVQTLHALFPKAHVKCHGISQTNSLWSSSEHEASGIPM